MSQYEQLPVEIEKTLRNGCVDSKEFSHPAFGVISVMRWQYLHPSRFYGSDLGHRGGLTVTISTSQLDRSLSGDRHTTQKVLTEFSMSETQWARFVASVGNGGGIPVTLNHYNSEALVRAPAIAQPEMSRKELHGEEIKAEVKKVVSDLQLELARMGELIESGKIGKKEMREMHREMVIQVNNLPANLGYSMDCFVKAADKVVEESKTEIEAHVNNLATRLGMEQLRSMAPVLPKFNESKILPSG